MDTNKIIHKLKYWRKKTAESSGVPLFMVLSNSTLENIAERKPNSKEQLINIKGISEKKYAKYGQAILAVLNDGETDDVIQDNKEDKLYTISEYLNRLNFEFRKYAARIKGEVSSLEIRDSYLFFSLKDKHEDGVLSCFMWKTNYKICGLALETGMEVIIEGYPEIYTPSGRFNFQTLTIEHVGEGTLKKAYDLLKRKLEGEGLFAEERKKPIPKFPQKIGLITSESGAVIHDFLNNLGRYGFHISFINSRVEGQMAVRSLLSAMKHFEDKDIDILVIIRGGGSLESLQAFNNEMLVRRIASFKKPIICGIGHDKDMPLASMAADKAVSTPTAATTILNHPWENIISDIFSSEKDIIYQFERSFEESTRCIDRYTGILIDYFSHIRQYFDKLVQGIKNILTAISYGLKDLQKDLALLSQSLLINFTKDLEYNWRIIDEAEIQLKSFSPDRQLRMGYSIIYVSGKVVKTVKQVDIKDVLNIKVSDGQIKSTIESIE